MNLIAKNGSPITFEHGGGLDSRIPGSPPAVTVTRPPADQPWGPWEDLVTEELGDGWVAYRLNHTGYYLTAENSGGGKLSTNRTLAAEWERFKPITLANGRLLIMTSDRQHYLDTDVNGVLSALTDIDETLDTFAPSGGGPTPTNREAICRVQTSFQGLLVNLPGIGVVPWFDIFLGSLTANQRAAVYLAKHHAGDTHQMLSISYKYTSGGYTYPVPGKDFTASLPAFRALAIEVQREGFVPGVYLAGDGQGYNADGGTYGWTWLMSNLNRLLDAIPDVTRCLALGGFEVIGPGGDWTSDQVSQFHLYARQLAPTGHFGLHMGQGYTKFCGDTNGHETTGPDCWKSAAGQAIDALLCEFPQPIEDGDHPDGCEQVTSSTLGPKATNIKAKNRLAWYLEAPTPRGPVIPVAYEYGLYDFVRDLDVQKVARRRAYLKTLGWAGVC